MEELTPRQYKALVHLAAGGSNKEAAEIAGVSLRSVEAWKSQPGFRRQLREATAKLFDMGMATLVLKVQDACEELCRIATAEETSDRTKISAIALLLSNASKVKDAELEQRLERLEIALDGSNQEPDTEA